MRSQTTCNGGHNCFAAAHIQNGVENPGKGVAGRILRDAGRPYGVSVVVTAQRGQRLKNGGTNLRCQPLTRGTGREDKKVRHDTAHGMKTEKRCRLPANILDPRGGGRRK